MKSEHDQLVILQERVKIFKEWFASQYYTSEVDEYKVWEDLKNDTIKRCENHFDFVFQTVNQKNIMEKK
jgi:hypothetical protein